MSGAISVGTIATAAAVGVGTMAVMKSMQPSGGQSTPATPTAPPTPQAPKAPDQRALRQASGGNYGAPTPGATGTMLTGASGVDPSALNLGKNTLLGQ